MTRRLTKVICASLYGVGAAALVLGCQQELPSSGEATSESSSLGSETSGGGETDESSCWSSATEFSELCFGAPITLLDQPTHLIERFQNSLFYVAGPGSHYLFRADELGPGAMGESLPIEGTTVAAWSTSLELLLVTREPNSLVRIDSSSEITDTILLAAEPTDVSQYFDGVQRHYVVSDVEGRLTQFGGQPGALAESGSRELPELIDRIAQVEGWDVESSGVLGLAHASETIWRLGSVTDALGGDEAWVLSGQPREFSSSYYHDEAAAQLLVRYVEPAHHTMWYGPEHSGSTRHTPAPIIEISGGKLPWTYGSVGLSELGVTLLAEPDESGHGTLWKSTFSWVEVPSDTVDFHWLGELGFVCASTSAGLTLVPAL